MECPQTSQSGEGHTGANEGRRKLESLSAPDRVLATLLACLSSPPQEELMHGALVGLCGAFVTLEKGPLWADAVP